MGSPAFNLGCIRTLKGYGSATERLALQELVGEMADKTEAAEMAGVWLPRARRVPSPNKDPRPRWADVELVVVHNISLPPGKFGSGMVEQLFCNQLDCTLDPALHDLVGVEVSSHLFIDRRGRATQFVPFDERAWHAGVSSWRGRRGCNDFAIGIELEGTDDKNYTAKQYARLHRVLLWLFRRYPRLATDTIVGHNEIAPGRKTDPGTSFDWARLIAGLNKAV